jgi:hypothetical protein
MTMTESQKPLRSYVLVMVVNVDLRGSKVAAQSFGDHLRALIKDGGGADDATVVHIIEQPLNGEVK